ncbi:hypothetical protein CBFG_03641 [Clostridiales bacterium 1_7_47FAA]|nr:hypothetical protein CBFG_03641 [Clostridiales bacterium 1_7_47FAA]
MDSICFLTGAWFRTTFLKTAGRDLVSLWAFLNLTTVCLNQKGTLYPNSPMLDCQFQKKWLTQNNLHFPSATFY